MYYTTFVVLCNVMDTSLVTMSLTEECTLNEFVCVYYAQQQIK